MAKIETNTTGTRFYQADEFGSCPECREAMNDMNRLMEDTYIFIWAECSEVDCNGKWLLKKPRPDLRRA